ncbi:hypothetical protein L6272_03915 [Microgenomates group bacterium]|nr:hypothetical protein [Microgenomates group bacterium]
MSNEKDTIGKVTWDWQGKQAHYISGLSEIEHLITFNQDRPQEFNLAVHTFCRELAIQCSPDGIGQFNIVKDAEYLIDQGALTPNQVSYIYRQFNFDPNNYQPKIDTAPPPSFA